MIEKIFVVILCFSLLFIAFNSDFIEPTAFDIYDGYKQFYFSSFPDSSYSLDDLWIDDNGIMYRCISDPCSGSFSNQHWSILKTNTILQNPVYDFFYYNFETEPYFDFEKQSDGKIELWYQSSDPSYIWVTDSDKALHDGDLWHNTDNDIQYEWFEDHWQIISVFNNSSATYDDIFGFGYELTIGTFEVITSIFKGPDVFFARFDQWRITLFGDVTILGFLYSFFTRCLDFLNDVAYSLPLIRDIKYVIDFVLKPFESIISPLDNWLKNNL